VSRYSIFLIHLLFALKCWSQAPELKFKHITKEQGLSSSTVEAILQDSKGFIWFGTADGLNRYDGYKITAYRNDPADSNSISGNYASQLLEDKKHRLWIGTNGGLNYFNRNQNKFIRYKNDPRNMSSISSNVINCIYEDRQGDIWIGTSAGLDLLARGKNSFKHYRYQEGKTDCLSSNRISCIYEDQHGNFWVGTNGGGLNLLDRKKNTVSVFKSQFTDDGSISSNNISSIEEDLSGNIWIGTIGGGLNLLDVKQKRFKHFRHQEMERSSLSGDVIKSMLIDTKGNLWVGTENGGLNLWNQDNQSFIHYENNPNKPSSLSQKTASAIMEDNQGNIWVGTHRGGVNLYQPNAYQFKIYSQSASLGSLSYNDVKTFFEDKEGNIWIGTDGGGLNIWNRRKDVFYRFRHDPHDPKSIGSDAILHIMKDSKGNIWIGTWGGGLNLYNPADGTFTRFLNDPRDKSSISSNNVWRIYEDQLGKLWIATFYGGLNVFNRETKKFTRITDDPEKKTHFYGNNVISINEDKSGNLWIGTEDGGLNCYNSERSSFSHYFYQIHENNVQGTDNIRVIYTDKVGRLWIGKKGLYLFNPKHQSFSLYTSKENLANEMIQGVNEDDMGNLWIGTSNGLIRFNPDTYNFKRFTDADGLQGLEFGPNSSLKTTKGEMLFGGFKGFNIFHPDSIKNNSSIPPVYLTDFQIFNVSATPGQKKSPLKKQISETKAITLSYDQSFFSFEFAALNYISPEQNQYAYKLDGFDKSWNYVGNQRKATYTNLDPGKYIFYVKASNNDGIWNEKGTSLSIIITPPFWMTWWFRTFIILVIIGGTGIFFQFKRKLELKKLEEQKREEMHQMQLRFFTNISHEFRTPLTLILGPLEKLRKENSDTIFNHHYNVIHRNANRLMELISELMDFRKVESGALKLNVMPGNLERFLFEIAEEFADLAIQKQITFIVLPSVLTQQIWFDRQVIEKIILNLVNNSFKYTADGGKITVELLTSLTHFKPSFENELVLKSGFKTKEYVYIRISDNGIGISRESIHHLFERYYRITDAHLGSGIGLAFVKSLTFLHKGEIYVYSEPQEGTEIIIGIPRNKDDYKRNERWTENIQEEGGIQLESINYAHEYAIESSDDSNMPTAVNTFSKYILIVDDNSELRDFLKQSLGSFYRISEAWDGNTGLAKAKEESPDLIISDVMMPGMNGIEFCRLIKEDTQTNHIPFILLTAKDALTAKIEGLESGADFYFGKPLSMDFLLLTIRNIFDQRQKQKERHLKDYTVEMRDLVHSTKDKDFMEQLLNLIEKDLENTELNVDYICQQIGMSKTNIYKKIKDITGQTINELIRTIRLKKAVYIMTHEDASLTEVMYRIGIQSQSYFTTIFKKEFGYTPSQFQQEIDRKSAR